MDMSPWLLGAGTVLLAQGVNLLFDGVRRGWAEKGKVADRSDRAADDLLNLLEEGRRLMPNSPNEVPQGEVCARSISLARKVALGSPR